VLPLHRVVGDFADRLERKQIPKNSAVVFARADDEKIWVRSDSQLWQIVGHVIGGNLRNKQMLVMRTPRHTQNSLGMPS
jgi:hypothetical protein